MTSRHSVSARVLVYVGPSGFGQGAAQFPIIHEFDYRVGYRFAVPGRDKAATLVISYHLRGRSDRRHNDGFGKRERFSQDLAPGLGKGWLYYQIRRRDPIHRVAPPPDKLRDVFKAKLL